MTIDWVRSFIAVELPDGLRLALGQLISRLRSRQQTYVKWVDPNSIHLTLKFLGDVDASRLDDIPKAMTEAVRGISPFHLEVKEMGVFPNPRRAQVAWIGLGGDLAQLTELQQCLEISLESLGYPAEARGFTPHLTLARLRNNAYPEERLEFGQLITGTKPELDYSFKVDSISLMKSQLTPQGAIYSRIGAVELK